MGELQKRINDRISILNAERSILEDLLTSDYFTEVKGSVKFALGDLEDRREVAFTELGNGLPDGTPEEASYLGLVTSRYGDAVGYLSDMLTIERDKSEQYIRTQVQGPMSGNFDDYYESFGVLAKEVNIPSQDIDNLTDSYTGQFSTRLAHVAEYQVKICDTLTEIAKACTALDVIVRVQVAIMRTRLAAFRLEKLLHLLRLELTGDRIAISEE